MKSYNKKILVCLTLVILATLFINVAPSQAKLENWTSIKFPACFDPEISTACTLTDVIQFAHGLTQTILGVAASLALLFVIYGGILWLVSSGNAEMITKGKKVLVGSLMGMLIIIGSWVMINTLIIGLTGGNLGSVGQIFELDWYKVKKEAPAKPRSEPGTIANAGCWVCSVPGFPLYKCYDPASAGTDEKTIEEKCAGEIVPGETRSCVCETTRDKTLTCDRIKECAGETDHSPPVCCHLTGWLGRRKDCQQISYSQCEALGGKSYHFKECKDVVTMFGDTDKECVTPPPPPVEDYCWHCCNDTTGEETFFPSVSRDPTLTEIYEQLCGAGASSCTCTAGDDPCGSASYSTWECPEPPPPPPVEDYCWVCTSSKDDIGCYATTLIPEEELAVEECLGDYLDSGTCDCGSSPVEQSCDSIPECPEPPPPPPVEDYCWVCESTTTGEIVCEDAILDPGDPGFEDEWDEKQTECELATTPPCACFPEPRTCDYLLSTGACPTPPPPTVYHCWSCLPSTGDPICYDTVISSDNPILDEEKAAMENDCLTQAALEDPSVTGCDCTPEDQFCGSLIECP